MKNRLLLIVAFIISAAMHAQRGPAVISVGGPDIVITSPKVEVTLPQVRVNKPQVVVVGTRTCRHYVCRKSDHCYHDNGKHKGHYKQKKHWNNHYDYHDHHGHKRHNSHGHGH